jgi:hypothetical protein
LTLPLERAHCHKDDVGGFVRTERIFISPGNARAGALLIFFLSASWGLLVWAGLCLADEPAVGQPGADEKRAVELNRMSPSSKVQLSENQRLESYYCSCYDEPNKHYPYSIVVLKTPNGDLVARPEGTDGALFFTPLAVRYGNRYCELDSDQDCYGSFSHPCEFTDFRYGPYLAEFFPTCKSE